MNPYFEWEDPQYVQRYSQIYAWHKEAILDYLAPLHLQKNDIFVDFGCGSGEVLAVAAPLVGEAIGIDPSAPQLEKAKFNTQLFHNTTLAQSDFLNCDLNSYRITKAASRKALHHLTDPQKEIFFHKLSESLNPRGLFMLEDGMVSFEMEDLSQYWKHILDVEAPAYYGERWESIRTDFIKSFEEEYPTSRRLLVQMLEKSGFEIMRSTLFSSFYGNILVRRKEYV